MKKILLLFFALAVAAMTTGCRINVDGDSACFWYFNIINQTEYDIIFIMGESEQIIKPNQEQTVSSLFALCGKDDKPGDIYPFEEQEMYISHDSQIAVSLKVSGEIVPDIIWKRKYWDFVDEVHQATYTLTVTDELLNSIKP